jgi:hypothetical protein
VAEVGDLGPASARPATSGGDSGHAVTATYGVQTNNAGGSNFGMTDSRNLGLSGPPSVTGLAPGAYALVDRRWSALPENKARIVQSQAQTLTKKLVEFQKWKDVQAGGTPALPPMPAGRWRCHGADSQADALQPHGLTFVSDAPLCGGDRLHRRPAAKRADDRGDHQ